MTTDANTMNAQEQKAIVSVCILAAFADGAQSEREREEIRRIVTGFSNADLNLAGAYQEALGGHTSLAEVLVGLQSPESKALAYEMAVCVCHADGVLSPGETRFLADLRQRLQLDASSDAVQDQAQAMAAEPVAPPALSPADPTRDPELDRMILNYAILTGALEIMPHSLATMAIVPVQMRMVYRIGRRYGYELGRGHIKDFLATVGVGLTAQVFESYTRRLVGGLGRIVAGGLLGGLLGQTAGSAFAFAATYALGQAAKRYYESGRTLSREQLKEVFASMLDEARGVQRQYDGQIAQKASEVKVAELLPLVKQS